MQTAQVKMWYETSSQESLSLSCKLDLNLWLTLGWLNPALYNRAQNYRIYIYDNFLKTETSRNAVSQAIMITNVYSPCNLIAL